MTYMKKLPRIVANLDKSLTNQEEDATAQTESQSEREARPSA